MSRSAKEMHERAIALCDERDEARRRGDQDAWARANAAAYPLERAAAELAESEPTRSVLFRSAATMALAGGVPLEALRLAERGLAGAGAPVPVSITARVEGLARTKMEGRAASSAKHVGPLR